MMWAIHGLELKLSGSVGFFISPRNADNSSNATATDGGATPSMEANSSCFKMADMAEKIAVREPQRNLNFSAQSKILALVAIVRLMQTVLHAERCHL